MRFINLNYEKFIWWLSLPFPIIVKVAYIHCLAAVLQFLTRYFPFSLFWKDRFFHFDNQNIVRQRERINELIRNFGVRFDVQIYDKDQYFMRLEGRFYKVNPHVNLKRKKDEIFTKLEQENMYIKQNKNKIQISIAQ